MYTGLTDIIKEGNKYNIPIEKSHEFYTKISFRLYRDEIKKGNTDNLFYCKKIENKCVNVYKRYLSLYKRKK